MNIQELEKSILFSNDIAEELNKEAVKIDRRLYCFAYYRPKKLPSGGNLRLIYQQSLLNIHGLLRECGPPIFDDVISPFFKQYCVSEFKNLKKNKFNKSKLTLDAQLYNSQSLSILL